MKGLKCPHCEKPLAFGKKMSEWDKEYGEDTNLNSEFPTMINLLCEECDTSVAMVFIEPTGEEEEVYNPMLDMKVKVPKRRTN